MGSQLDELLASQAARCHVFTIFALLYFVYCMVTIKCDRSIHMYLCQIPFSRRLRQIGQELFQLHPSNRHAEPVTDHGVVSYSEEPNHILKQSGQPGNQNASRQSHAHKGCGAQDQNAVHQIVCDSEVVFKTSAVRRISPW